MGYKSVPEVEGKIWIGTAETGDEVFLPSADGFFRWIITVVVRRDELEIYFFKAHVSFAGIEGICYPWF